MNLYLKHIYTTVALLAIVALTGCSDDTDADADRGSTPQVDYVKQCEIDPNDEHIQRAYPGSMVCFVGSHLGDVQQVWFNDQKCLLNPTMVTSHTVICTIPTTFPGEVTNTARLITSTGITTEVPFEVIIPGPTIKSMSLEYAKPGDNVTIQGTYFTSEMTVKFTGDVEATTVSVSQNEAVIVVPEGAQEGPITVVTPFGEDTSSFHYLDKRGLMFDFDGITGLGNHGWHNAVIETDENAVSGNYMRLGDPTVTMPGSGTWDDSHFAFEYWAGDDQQPMGYPADGVRLFDIVDFSDWQNMSLKFEMCIPATNAWQASPMQIIFAGTDLVSYGWCGVDIYGNTVATANNSFFQEGANPGYPRILYQPWTTSEAFHTSGQWITVTIPLTDAAYNYNGASATQTLTPESFASMTIFVVGGSVEGVDCQPVIKIDNIRAVPNN